MILTENVQKWSNIISETLHVENQGKLNWMSQYAANHEIFEAAQSVTPDPSAGIYTTPLNTLGMGNPAMPSNAGIPGGSFGNQKVGSGDIPMSTLTMSLEIAAMTIGLELVPVIPANGPWAMLSYMDFPYAGGKRGLANETAMDGLGDGASNKPIYVKVTTARGAQLEAKKLDQGSATPIYFTASAASNLHGHGGESAVAPTLKGTYIGNSRIDNSIIVKVVGVGTGVDSSFVAGATYSIADVFDSGKVTITIGNTKYTEGKGTDEDPTVDSFAAKVDLVAGAADHVQGFSNFATGSADPMSRAENETGVGNTIGARMFTRLVQMGAYEVTGAVTRQQLQDMPLYGVDVVGKVLEAMQNQISQEINNRILDRIFKMGVENAKVQHDYQGINLNLFFGSTATAEKNLTEFTAAKKMKDLNNETSWQAGWTVKNATQNTAAENVHTHQRRIMSRALAAANIIANVSRFGRGTFLVTNTQILSALQDCSGFVVAPMTNTLTQDGSQSLYFAGSLAGLNIYVDPYMTWEDTRICVGRKSDGNTPGIIFMPYILADTVQTVVEGTMAPKLLVNSRFAIVEAGFHCEQSYYTFAVQADGEYFL